MLGIVDHLGELGDLLFVHLVEISVLFLDKCHGVNWGVGDAHSTLSAMASRVASVSSVSRHAALHAHGVAAHVSSNLADHAHEVVVDSLLSGLVGGLSSSQVISEGVPDVTVGSSSSFHIGVVSSGKRVSVCGRHIIPPIVAVSGVNDTLIHGVLVVMMHLRVEVCVQAVSCGLLVTVS